MADPVTLGLTAVSSIAQGSAASAQAAGERIRAENNAYIGKTRAIQTDTTSRMGLESEVANLRAVLGANQQGPNVGTLEIVNELRRIRGRERRIEVGNRMQESRDFAQQARNARAQQRGAMIGGVIGAGPAMFDLYQWGRSRG